MSLVSGMKLRHEIRHEPMTVHRSTLSRFDGGIRGIDFSNTSGLYVINADEI